MKNEMSKAQQKAWQQITSAPVGTPTTVYGWTWKCVEDWTSPSSGHTWKSGMVYGTFNTATIRALEKAGLIKIHEVGGGQFPDTIEICAAT